MSKPKIAKILPGMTADVRPVMRGFRYEQISTHNFRALHARKSDSFPLPRSRPSFYQIMIPAKKAFERFRERLVGVHLLTFDDVLPSH